MGHCSIPGTQVKLLLLLSILPGLLLHLTPLPPCPLPLPCAPLTSLSDMPSPARRLPARLGIADLMELDALTPGSAGRKRRSATQQPPSQPTPISWADQVEAADALFEGCDRFLQSMQEEGDGDGEVVGPLGLAAAGTGASPPERAGTRPRSASLTPAKRAATCLGEWTSCRSVGVCVCGREVQHRALSRAACGDDC